MTTLEKLAEELQVHWWEIQQVLEKVGIRRGYHEELGVVCLGRNQLVVDEVQLAHLYFSGSWEQRAEMAEWVERFYEYRLACGIPVMQSPSAPPSEVAVPMVEVKEFHMIPEPWNYPPPWGTVLTTLAGVMLGPLIGVPAALSGGVAGWLAGRRRR